MKFNIAKPNENFFFRFVSENKVWEIGLHRVMFGVRVRLGQVDDQCLSLDYCAGASEAFQIELLQTVMVCLLPYPESVTPGQIGRDFPKYDRKPINLDPCWEKLKQKARSAIEALGSQEALAPSSDSEETLSVSEQPNQKIQ